MNDASKSNNSNDPGRTVHDGRTFVRNPAGIFQPESKGEKEEAKVKINATLRDERTIPVRTGNLDKISSAVIALANSLSAAIALGTLIGLVFTVKFAIRQWGEMTTQTHQMEVANANNFDNNQRSYELSKEALVNGQRAVVALEDFSVSRERGSKGDIDGVQIRITWKNSGSTATKNLIYWSNWRIQRWDQKVDKSFNFNDVFDFSAKKVPYMHGFATPQKSVGYYPIVIPRNIVASVQVEQLELVFWGKATYNDVFGPDPHTSEFCLIVMGFDGTDPFDPTFQSGATYPRFISCPVHNCHDDECRVE